MKSVGIIGARGYTGKELVDLMAKHDGFKVELAVSARDNLTADDVAKSGLDAYFLALPNGACQPYVDAITKVRPDAVIVDISADKRFYDTDRAPYDPKTMALFSDVLFSSGFE